MTKLLFLLSFLLSLTFPGRAQTQNLPQWVKITNHNKKTKVHSSKNGDLLVNVSPQDVQKFKAKGSVSYPRLAAAMAAVKPASIPPKMHTSACTFFWFCAPCPAQVNKTNKPQ